MLLENNTATETPYPLNRRLMADGGWLGLQKHTVHGLLELDVTYARDQLRQYKAATGATLSFTAFFLACLGQALDQHKSLHAYRNWRNQIVVFDDVDINTLFEVEGTGQPALRHHILRAVNHKTLSELHAEIRAVQQQSLPSQTTQWIEWFVRLPSCVRRVALRWLFRSPPLIKRYAGTVLVSSVGMFGTGGGWGLPVPNHTLQFTLGGIALKPGIIEKRIEIREYLCVTISFDHNLMDGAPVARFIQYLKELVEGGHGLAEALGTVPSIGEVVF
jgi:pyruvate/2-oxoglutarate dehydrogenase complex dihydrolipoamide acyltransferase (E2) component